MGRKGDWLCDGTFTTEKPSCSYTQLARELVPDERPIKWAFYVRMEEFVVYTPKR